MKIRRYTLNDKTAMPCLEVVLNIIEVILYLGTIIFTTAFGLCVSSYIPTTRDKKLGNGIISIVLSKAIDYIIKGPILGFISLITFPSSLLAFMLWMAMCKCK